MRFSSTAKSCSFAFRLRKMQQQKSLLGHGEVQTALKKAAGPSATLKSFQVRPLGKHVGFMGEHSILEVEYQEARISYQAMNRITFFIKRVPDVKTLRDFIVRFGLFTKEREMYEKLLPMMSQALRISKMCVPDCHLIKDKDYMIFENLGASGFKMHNKLELLNLDQCKAVIEAVAQLHAGSIAIEAKSGKLMSFHMENHQEVCFSKDKQVSNNITAYWHIASQETTLHLILKIEELRSRASKVSKEMLRQKIAREWDRSADMASGFSATFENVLSHGDLWINNFMFKQTPGSQWKVVLVDFQTYRYAPPMLDLLTILHLTTDRKFRWNHQSELIKFYHKTLSKMLEKAEVNLDLAPPLEELERSAFEMRNFGIAIAARYKPNLFCRVVL
jgi:hypothetical protein